MKKLFLLFLILIIAVACDDEKDITPEKTKLLNVQVDASYTAGPEEQEWIVVHSEEGEVLAFESFQGANDFVLETEKTVSGNITITWIHYSTRNTVFKNYRIETFTDVDKGKTMVFKSDASYAGSVNGFIYVSISDVNPLDQSTLASSVGGGGIKSWSNETKILDIKHNTHTGIDKYIVSIDDGSELKYKVLDHVQPNDHYSFSFLDMPSFDNTITFNFPMASQVSLAASGSDPNSTLKPNSYSLLHHYGTDRTSIRAGYLDNMDNYTTRLTLSYYDHELYYIHSGAIPNPNIVWPSMSDFHVVSPWIEHYVAETSKPFVWRSSSWFYDDNEISIDWTVYGSSGVQVIHDLPSEIVLQHPILELSNMVPYSTTFHTEAIPYSEFIDSYFASYYASQLEAPGTKLGIMIYE